MSYSCFMKSDFWASFYNQAALPFITSGSIGVSYENRFGISELGSATAAAIIPAGKSSLGAVYSHFGGKDYVRHTGALACGLKLTEKISAGVQIDYYSEKFPGTEIQGKTVTFEGGVIIAPTGDIRVGIHIFNPVPNSIRKKSIPSTICAGAGIYLNRMLFASAGIRMSGGKNPALVAGIEFEAVTNFWVRGGFSSENTSFSFGFGYKFKSVKIDLGFASHETLGITSSASLIFQIR